MIVLFFLCSAGLGSSFAMDLGRDLEAQSQLISGSAEKDFGGMLDEPADLEEWTLRQLAVTTKFPRSLDENSEMTSIRLVAEQLVHSCSDWVYPPISEDLITVVIPGMVLNHGKVGNSGLMILTAVAQDESSDERIFTNLTVLHAKFTTTYKYNLDGPKGRLEVEAPSRIYSILLRSKEEDSQCVTIVEKIALRKEDELKFKAYGESPEGLNPHLQVVRHLLTLQSRLAAYKNIRATLDMKLQTQKPPLCHRIR